MMSVEVALARLLAAIPVLETETLPLRLVANRVLAISAYAGELVPPFANSAMDGYALRSADTRGASESTPRLLRALAVIPAGHLASAAVEPGTAMRIMTGAPLPEGADAVLQVELTRSAGEMVELKQEVALGNNVRPAGDDLQPGKLAVPAGTLLNGGEISVLASLGVNHVVVYRRPRVAILATGDELVELNEPLKPGQIRNSNSYALAALVETAGGIPQVLGIARDTREALRAKIAEAQGADLFISSGGVSVGDFDLVKDILAEAGNIEFWRVNLKPGKPLAFGRLGAIPFLGLPGNPVSSIVTFLLFGRPALRKMQGHTRLGLQQIPVVLDEPIVEFAGRRHYVRAKVEQREGQFHARTTGPQGSHISTSLVGANALIVVPEEQGNIPAGEILQAMMLYWPEV